MPKRVREGTFNRFCQVTKQRPMAWTLHDWTPAHVATLTALGSSNYCKGMGWQYEVCPQTGRPHLQGWVNLTNEATWPSFKARVGIATLHCELAESIQALCVYCQKEDTRDPDHPDPVVLGKKPMTQEGKGAAGEEYYARNLTALDEGRPEDLDPSAEYNRRNYEYAIAARKHQRMLKCPKLPGRACQYFEWHCGVTGSGKSHYTDQFDGAFVWTPDNGWNGYDYQDVVVFSDIDAAHKPTLGQFKNWFDLCKFAVRALYVSKLIRPKRMIVNTNEETFEAMFPNVGPQHIAAIKRRFRVYVWSQPYYLDEALEILNPDWFDPTKSPLGTTVPSTPSVGLEISDEEFLATL